MRWIFLRGLTREQRHWGDFPDHFRAANPGAEIVTPDLPGNGERWRERSPTDIRGMVDRCRGALALGGIARPFGIVALSLGAMVASDWLRAYPGEVRAAVLISTSLRPFSPFYQRLRPRSYPSLLRLLLPGMDARRREQEILRLTSCRHGDDAALLADWSRWRRERPVSRLNAVRQLLAASRYRAVPQRPSVPVLLLAGGGDRLVDPRCSARLAAAWQLPLKTHPWAGHDLPLDDPHWVAETISAWCREIDAG